MVIKIYISGISASQEIRKKQQRVLFILESLKIDHEIVDITEPGKEDVKTFMREECSKRGRNNALPPQLFIDDHYLGDYSDFENATEDDQLMTFFQLPERNFSKDKNGDAHANEDATEEANEENKGGLNLVNGICDLVTNGQEDEEVEEETKADDAKEESETKEDEEAQEEEEEDDE